MKVEYRATRHPGEKKWCITERRMVMPSGKCTYRSVTNNYPVGRVIKFKTAEEAEKYIDKLILEDKKKAEAKKNEDKGDYSKSWRGYRETG